MFKNSNFGNVCLSIFYSHPSPPKCQKILHPYAKDLGTKTYWFLVGNKAMYAEICLYFPLTASKKTGVSPHARVVVNIMVPFWILIIVRHLIFRVPKKGP